MRQRLTPEEKAQRVAERKAATILARQQRIADTAARILAEKEAARQAFSTGLSERERAALDCILGPLLSSEEPCQDMFMQSLANQYANKGVLSAKQLSIVVDRHTKKLHAEQQAANFKPLAVGDIVETLVPTDKVSFVMEPHPTGRAHVETLVIRFTGPDGRRFKFKTRSVQSINSVRAAIEEKELVCMKALVSWISDDGLIAVLSGPGSRVRRMLE